MKFCFSPPSSHFISGTSCTGSTYNEAFEIWAGMNSLVNLSLCVCAFVYLCAPGYSLVFALMFKYVYMCLHVYSTRPLSLKPCKLSGSDQSKHTHTQTPAPLRAMLLETWGPKCLTDGLLTNTTLSLGPQVFPVFGFAVIYNILT